MTPTKKDIMSMMEHLHEGQELIFKTPETFGGALAIIALNPNYPQKGEKKYLLRIGKDEESARGAKPFWTSDKPKHLAGWVSDRLGEPVDRQPPLVQEAV